MRFTTMNIRLVAYAVKLKYALWQIFYMSSPDNDLQPFGAAYTADVDLAAVRARLRKERKARDWSLDDLAEKSGVNRSTIHEIETSATGKPQFETVGRLIEGMGLTLSEFFTRIEGLHSRALTPTGQADLQSASPEAGDDAALSAADRSADAYVRMQFVEALAEQLVKTLDRLVSARAPNRSAKTTKPRRRRRPRTPRRPSA